MIQCVSINITSLCASATQKHVNQWIKMVHILSVWLLNSMQMIVHHSRKFCAWTKNSKTNCSMLWTRNFRTCSNWESSNLSVGMKCSNSVRNSFQQHGLSRRSGILLGKSTSSKHVRVCVGICSMKIIWTINCLHLSWNGQQSGCSFVINCWRVVNDQCWLQERLCLSCPTKTNLPETSSRMCPGQSRCQRQGNENQK